MNRRAFITISSAAFILVAGQSFAASVEDDIIKQLSKQGFTDISSETTWLGRLRILASRKDGEREIVVNPRTGEILRDQFTASDGSDATQPILDDVADGSGGSDTKDSDKSKSDGVGSGSNGSDDHGADDNGSDGNSGSGNDSGSGGGSGSGSGGNSGSHGGGGGEDKGKDN